MEFVEDIVDDFEDFLNEENDQALKAFGIKDDVTANYYVARVKKNKDIKAMYEAKAKRILDDYELKVKLWLEKHVNSIDKDSERCLSLLEDYYKNVNGDDQSKKIRLPDGNIGFYKTQASISVDREDISFVLETLRSLQKDKGLDVDKYIKIKEDLNLKELKKDGEIDDTSSAFKLEGIVLDSVKTKPSSLKFNIR